MVEALERPAKDSYLYLKFTYGSTPTVVKYVDWHDPADNTYVYNKFSVEIADNTGGFEDNQTRIELAYGDAFTQLLTRGEALPIISVEIKERSVPLDMGDDPTELTLFKGRVVKIVKNLHQKDGSVLITCYPIKARLDVPLGLLCTQQCVWNFGGRGCNFDVVAARETGTVTAVNNDRSIVVTGAPTVRPRPNWWRQGYVSYDGVNIVIREWNPAIDGTRFLLRERAPLSWVGKIVTFTPGCDKTIENCRDWSNEARFAGLGIAMPSYHPNFEG